jgi:hypothetical protein
MAESKKSMRKSQNKSMRESQMLEKGVKEEREARQKEGHNGKEERKGTESGTERDTCRAYVTMLLMVAISDPTKARLGIRGGKQCLERTKQKKERKKER